MNKLVKDNIVWAIIALMIGIFAIAMIRSNDYIKEKVRKEVETEIVYVMAGGGNMRIPGTRLLVSKLANGDTLVSLVNEEDIRFESQIRKEAKK